MISIIRLSATAEVRRRLRQHVMSATLTLAVVLGLTGGALVASEAQGNPAAEKAPGQSLDRITRAVQRKYGRVLAISQDTDGRIKAKVLTADGRVRYLDLDPGFL